MILQHPIMRDHDTVEDPSVTSPEDRRAHFGQEDHVRIYGRDFKTRLERAGFVVQIVEAERAVPASTVERYSLRESALPAMSGSDLYLCRFVEP